MLKGWIHDGDLFVLQPPGWAFLLVSKRPQNAKLLKVLPYWLATGRHLERFGFFFGGGRKKRSGSTRKANKCTKEVCETHGVSFCYIFVKYVCSGGDGSCHHDGDDDE